MKKFGLIGDPIAHSLSPALFRAGYGGKYPYELIEGSSFESSWRRFEEEFDGINVTAPFKELAFDRADILSEECKMILATNLMVKTIEGVKAYNSDFLGVRKWLEEEFALLGGPCKVLVAGCGGAGKAVAAAAHSLSADVLLMNRDASRADRVAQHLASFPTGGNLQVRPLGEFCSGVRECGIVIYNIPAPIAALEALSADDFEGGKVILEANYRCPSFRVLPDGTIASSQGLGRYVDGRKWLLYQALTGYEIFTGEMPDLSSMEACL